MDRALDKPKCEQVETKQIALKKYAP